MKDPTDRTVENDQTDHPWITVKEHLEDRRMHLADQYQKLMKGPDGRRRDVATSIHLTSQLGPR